MANVDVVIQFVEAINAHDPERIAALITLDHEFIDSLGGVVRGRESVRAAWRAYFAFCPDYWVRPDEVIGGANCVVALGQAGGTIIEAGQIRAANAWRTPAAWRAVVGRDFVEHWQVYADNKPVHDILARLQSAHVDAR